MISIATEKKFFGGSLSLIWLFTDPWEDGPGIPSGNADIELLLSKIETGIENAMSVIALEFNDDFTRLKLRSNVEAFFQSIVEIEPIKWWGIADYWVICDTTNNPPTTIDANELRLELYLNFYGSKQKARLIATVTPQKINIK